MAHAVATTPVVFVTAVAAAAAAAVSALAVARDVDRASHHAARQEQTQDGNQTGLHRSFSFDDESPAVGPAPTRSSPIRSVATPAARQ